nr:hypothetical protein [Oryza sativa Japonica Group]
MASYVPCSSSSTHRSRNFCDLVLVYAIIGSMHSSMTLFSVCKILSLYVDMCFVDYSKEVHSYLKYCKDVVFTGMTFSLEEEHLIDIFWDMYKGKEDENAKLCQEKLRTTNGVNKRCRDGRFEDNGINNKHNSIRINKGILIFHIIPDYHPENPWNVLHPSNKRFEERKSCTDAGMLPGPLLPLPPPPPPELVVYPSVPSLPPSATPPSSSSSIGSSIAIVVLVVITTAIVTVAIVVIRRSYRRGRRLSCSSFSPRRSLSPRALSSSPSAMSQMWRAAVAAVGSSPRASAASARSWPEMAAPSSAPGDPGRGPPVALSSSAQGAVQGTAGLMASSATSAAAMAPPPSAPSLPEVERVILELLSLPPSPLQPAMSGSTATCFICNKLLLPTDLHLVLPVCSHMFHQRCLVAWLRSRVTPLLCCPECHAPITTRCRTDKRSLVPTFCSGEYDIESQILAVPAPPGEEVAEAVGGSRGWLRSSLDRLSGSWRACSGSRAVAAVAAPGCSSSRRTTGSWSPGTGSTSGRHLHLGADSRGVQTEVQLQLQLPVLPLADEEVAAADDDAGGSRGWLRSSLATLSGSWAVFPTTSRSTAMELPVSSSRRTAAGSTDSWSGSWDPEALRVSEPQPRERPSVLDYARWVFRNSGKYTKHRH